MATGIQTPSFEDLDDIFEPKQAGDSAVPTTGFQISNGTDINQRFAPASVGSILNSNTSLQAIGGTDLRNIFCHKGTRRVVSITTATIGSFGGSNPSSSVSRIEFERKGEMRYVHSGSSDAYYDDWITPKTATSGDLYEIKFHIIQDAPNLGASGDWDTWLPLSSDHNVFHANINPQTAIVQVQIRDAGGTVQDTATYTLEVLGG